MRQLTLLSGDETRLNDPQDVHLKTEDGRARESKACFPTVNSDVLGGRNPVSSGSQRTLTAVSACSAGPDGALAALAAAVAALAAGDVQRARAAVVEALRALDDRPAGNRCA